MLFPLKSSALWCTLTKTCREEDRGLLSMSKSYILVTQNQQLATFNLESGFPDGIVVKNPPASAGDQAMWVRSLGLEDPLE